ncbi:SH3 domain-containing protein [Escherichia coli]|nr:SH3 domain-containing protein [Escherichia coli]
MTVNKVKDIKHISLSSNNKTEGTAFYDYLNEIKGVRHKKISGLLNSEYIYKNLVKQFVTVKKQDLINDCFRKELESLPKVTKIAHQFREQIVFLQKQYQAAFPSDANEHIQIIKNQAEMAMPLRKHSEAINKLAGLNNMEEVFKELHSNINYKIKISKDIKEILKQYNKTRSVLLEQVVELGLVTIAQAYADDSIKSAHTESEHQNKGFNKSSSTFFDSFKALPSPIQIFLLWIFYQVVLGAITDYAKEKTLSQIYKVESYLLSLNEDKPISKQKLTQENKDIQWEELNNFRAITGDNVRLHVGPSLNSEVIECIGKNTIVAILDKKDRQWLYVRVKSGDEFITGWITRTYTKPLKA